MSEHQVLRRSVRIAAKSLADEDLSASRDHLTQAPYPASDTCAGRVLHATRHEHDVSTPSWRHSETNCRWQEKLHMDQTLAVEESINEPRGHGPMDMGSSHMTSRTDSGIDLSIASSSRSHLSTVCTTSRSSVSSLDSSQSLDDSGDVNNGDLLLTETISARLTRPVCAGELANALHKLIETASPGAATDTLARLRYRRPHVGTALPLNYMRNKARCRSAPPGLLCVAITAEHSARRPIPACLPRGQPSQCNPSFISGSAMIRSSSSQNPRSRPQKSQHSRRPGEGDDDADDHDGEDPFDPPQGVPSGSGYCCIFCIRDSQQQPTNEQPTDACAYNREYTSKLRVHHINGQHPDGPFGCCPKCYSIGGIDSMNQFERFTSLAQVEAHKKRCTVEICIDELCHNYNTMPNHHQPCQHNRRHTQRQIWRMWYRQAHGLQQFDFVPEPHLPGGISRLQIPSTSSRARSVSLPTPLAPLSSMNAPGHIEPAYLEEVPSPHLVSPSGDVLTPVSTEAQSLANMSAAAETLVEMARDLLSRVQEQPRTITGVMSNMYADALRSCQRLLSSLPATDIELTGRIERFRTLLEECWRLMVSPADRTLHAWLDLRLAARLALGIQLSADMPQSWLYNVHPEQILSAIPADNHPYQAPEGFDILQTHQQTLRPQSLAPTITYTDHTGGSAHSLMDLGFDENTRTLIHQSSNRGTYNPFNFNGPLQPVSTSEEANEIRDSFAEHNYRQSRQGLQPVVLTAQDEDAQSAFSAPADSAFYSAATSMDFDMGSRNKGKERVTDAAEGSMQFWQPRDDYR